MKLLEGPALWLLPFGDAAEKLRDVTAGLSRKYDAPEFEPHLTLLSRFPGTEKDLVKKASRLAEFLEPVAVELTEVGYLDAYYRCLFIRAAETRELMEANEKAREIFDRQNDPAFMPHVSLMYGYFEPEKKEEIIKDIGREFRLSFTVQKLSLVDCTGGPDDWRKVREFPL